MNYSSLEQCLIDLEKHGYLIRVKEEVDPYLEMAAIHLRVHEKKGPAILFENVKGTKFRAVSNIFGTLERSKFIFRKTFAKTKQIIELKNDPAAIFKHPFKNISTAFAALKALPLKNPGKRPILYEEINIADLPLVHHWKNDGGAFITFPQVYTEDADFPGVMKSNLGMYRIQLNGNDYELNKEVGLHYQLHRGIGIHQTKANKKGIPLKVSCFIGGSPSHTLAAIMPLPEGMSELTFAGILGGRRFRYFYENGYCISADADFVITGEIYPFENKPEGPFGDHLGYYSLKHPFPVMKVYKVYAKKNAIWPFTVVGRPPQEDTSFGELIHELTGNEITREIPGLKEINAVDAAGVHPLLLAVGSERYTPFMPVKQPAEILTIANHILGTGQLSLAKFLFITADESGQLSAKNIQQYLQHVLERIDFSHDIHFYTNTTIDTLDYSGTELNRGSKVVFAAYGDVKRELCKDIPPILKELSGFANPVMIIPGIIGLKAEKYTDQQSAEKEFQILNKLLSDFRNELSSVALIIICDDSDFICADFRNFLWITFTRSNPALDIHGISEFVKDKSWGCEGPLIIDARIKPNHAPAVQKDEATEEKIDRIFKKGSLSRL